MRYFILSLNSLNNSFSIFESGDKIRFKYHHAYSKIGDITNISSDDFILGYKRGINLIKYVFKVTNVNVHEEELVLEKVLETNNGVIIEDSDIINKFESQEITEIKEQDFIKLYNKLIKSLDLFNGEQFSSEGDEEDEVYVYDFESDESRQRIFFGAPGTGKSFNLDLKKDGLIRDKNDYERVTFHKNYTYANFVGTYKPVPLDKDKTKITYKYVPGPFLRLLVKAFKNLKSDENTKPYVLVIEEINRANVSAVFGDIFQLLDRDENNNSEFPIDTSKDMRDYLEEQLKDYKVNCQKLYLPSNFFIWATMNSADQGVFPMDTAFKRRWDFTYLKIDNDEEKINQEWNIVRKAINNQMSEYNINEDKLLGPFFIPLKQLPKDKKNIFEDEDFKRIFKNKIIMYLFEDGAKPKRNNLFEGSKGDDNYATYSKICADFEKMYFNIFSPKIIEEVEEGLKKLKTN